jgi:hypothetical protein
MTGIPHFINSGKSVLFEKTSDKILHETFPCREFEHVLENIKIYSLILSPLIVNDQCFGMISFMSTDSERYYSLEDQNNCDIYCNVISYALYHELSNSFKINKHSWTPTKIFKNILNLN